MSRHSRIFAFAVVALCFQEIISLQIRMTPPTDQQLWSLLQKAKVLNNQDMLYRRRSLSLSQKKEQDKDEYFIAVEIRDNQELDSPFIDLESQNHEKKQSKDK